MTQAKKILVPSQPTPIRLDQFLIQSFPSTSRSFWKENLENLVKLNGRSPKKGVFLTGGEKIEIHGEILTEEEMLPDPNLKIKILLEDPSFLIAEKPAGVPVHPLKPGERGSLIQAVIAHYPEVGKIGPSRREGGLVHRLDTGTSGVVLIARNEKAYQFFREEFQHRRVEKEYLALVFGRVEGEVGREVRIDLPIIHHPKNSKKMKVASVAHPGLQTKIFPRGTSPLILEGRQAVTFYKIEQVLKDTTLLWVRIPTGVRHQIRVHLAHLGYPIVGDILYGGKDVVRQGLDRFLLHATRLAFRHPKTLKWFECRSQPPEEFKINEMK